MGSFALVESLEATQWEEGIHHVERRKWGDLESLEADFSGDELYSCCLLRNTALTGQPIA